MLEHHLEKLITFVGVADAGSIRKFAVTKRLSQPGVSQRISGLEKLVGLPLISRSRNGIQLTKHGRALYELGVKMIKEAQAVETELYRSTKKDVEIKLGTYDSVAIYLMPSVIKEMQKRLPYVRIKLHCDRSVNVIRQVSDGTYDVGLCVTQANSKKIVTSPLYEDRYGFYASSSAARDQTLITVTDAEDGDGKSIASHLKLFGIASYHLLAAPSFEVVKAMTLAGLGIGILPHRVAYQSLQVGLLKKAAMTTEVPLSFGLHSFGLVTRRGTLDMTEPKMLLEVIQAEISKQVFR